MGWGGGGVGWDEMESGGLGMGGLGRGVVGLESDDTVVGDETWWDW